jgi:arabinofuranosyltransferase
MAGPVIYGLYLLYIGGDFMMGRHFTLLFFISLICYIDIQNREFSELGRGASFQRTFTGFVIAAVAFTATSHVITDQFLFGRTFGSPISDERAGYFTTSSLFNNVYSLITTGDLCIRNTWNDDSVKELRDNGMSGGILTSVPGITKYYNNDLYLNDLYALGDPFLAHLPAVKEHGWRIGHMWREAPVGYMNLVRYKWGTGAIKNEPAKQYYEIIDEITRGDLFDSERIAKVININLGKYDYLLDEYKATLDENNRVIIQEGMDDDSIAGSEGSPQ